MIGRRRGGGGQPRVAAVTVGGRRAGGDPGRKDGRNASRSGELMVKVATAGAVALTRGRRRALPLRTVFSSRRLGVVFHTESEGCAGCRFGGSGDERRPVRARCPACAEGGGGGFRAGSGADL